MNPGLLWAHTVVPVLWAAVVALSATGAGLALLRAAAGARRLSGFEAALAPALGMGAMGWLADVIFITGRVNMRPVYVAQVLIGLALLAWCRRWLPPFERRAAAPVADRMVWIAGWAVIAWFAVKLIIGNITPMNDNDSILHYGFYSQALAAGITFEELLLLKNFPLTDLNRLIEHVYAVGGTLGGEGALHMVNFLFIASLALAAQGVMAGLLRVTHWPNPLPVLAFLSLRELVYTGFAFKLDYGVAMLEVVALALWVSWRDRRWWMLPVALGFALCARTNSLRLAAVLPLLWLVDQWWSRHTDGGLAALARRTVLVGAGVVVMALPPYGMQQLIYGNPVFPVFNDLFGEYQHYYEWVLFESLRYKTDYGWLGAVAVYVQTAGLGLFTIPGVTSPPNTSFGLSVLMLLTPLAIRRDRRLLFLLGFVALSYLTWFSQTNTHRTLLSTATVAVLLAAFALARLRPKWAQRVAVLVVAGLAGWTADSYLGFNYLDHNAYAYARGLQTRAEYHDALLPRLLPSRILPSADLDAIVGIVGDAPLGALNLAPFSDPRLIRTKRVSVSGRSMADVAADETVEAQDRRIARDQLTSPWLAQQADAVRARLWPPDGAQRPLEGWHDLRWYLTASYDAQTFLADDLLADPARMAPMLRFEGIRFLLVPVTSVYAQSPIPQLTEVWRSDMAVLLRVEMGLT